MVCSFYSLAIFCVHFYRHSYFRLGQHLTSDRLICDLPSAAIYRKMHNVKLNYKYEQCNYTYFHYRAACRRATSNNAKIEFLWCANACARGRRNLNVDYPRVRRLETSDCCDWPTREKGRGRIIVASASVHSLGAATVARSILGERIAVV